MSSRLHFGIIGVGNISPIHAAAIRHTPDAELVAVATRNPATGQAFVQAHGGTLYADYRELLARRDVDIVTICAPHHLHLPMALDAAAAGKHVLVEKPMANSIAECDRMIEACDKMGVKLGVIFPWRFEPLSAQLKQSMMDGTLGRLLGMHASMLWYRTDEYYRAAPWRTRWAEAGGGVLMNQAIHAVDLLIWLVGMPNRVTAQVRTLGHDIEVEDSATAVLEYADGWTATLVATTNAFPGFPERFDFWGSRGTAFYHKGKGRLEWHLRDPKVDRVDEGAFSSGAGAPMDISAAGHIAEFQDYVLSIRDGAQPLVHGREGRWSVELVEAIYRSSRSSAPVNLPL